MTLDIWTLLAIASKFALYLAAFGAAGTVIFRAAYGPALRNLGIGTRRWIAGFALLGLILPGLRLPVRGAMLLGDPAGLTDTAMISLLLSTAVGTVVMLREAGFLLILLSLFLPRLRNGLGLIGAGLVLASFAAIGHATEAGGLWVRVMLFLHLATAAFWIGGLFAAVTGRRPARRR